MQHICSLTQSGLYSLALHLCIEQNSYNLMTCRSSDPPLLFVPCVSGYWTVHWCVPSERLEGRKEPVRSVGDTGRCCSKDKGWDCTRRGAGAGWRWKKELGGQTWRISLLLQILKGRLMMLFMDVGACFFQQQISNSFGTVPLPDTRTYLCFQGSLVAKGGSESISVMPKLRVCWQRRREPGKGYNPWSVTMVLLSLE